MKLRISLSLVENAAPLVPTVIPPVHKAALVKIGARAKHKKAYRVPDWLSPYIVQAPGGYRHISDGKTYYGSISPDNMLVPPVQPAPPNQLPTPQWSPAPGSGLQLQAPSIIGDTPVTPAYAPPPPNAPNLQQTFPLSAPTI